MQNEQLVQKLRTLATLYNETYLLSLQKSDLLLSKDSNLSIKVEFNGLLKGYLYAPTKKMLIEILSNLIYQKIDEILSIENEIYSYVR